MGGGVEVRWCLEGRRGHWSLVIMILPVDEIEGAVTQVNHARYFASDREHLPCCLIPHIH